MKIHLRLQGTYAPSTKRRISNCQNISMKKLHAHLDNLDAFVQFCKSRFFVVDVKKVKHISEKALFLAPIFFYTA
jgi:hypothetical protein